MDLCRKLRFTNCPASETLYPIYLYPTYIFYIHILHICFCTFMYVYTYTHIYEYAYTHICTYLCEYFWTEYENPLRITFHSFLLSIQCFVDSFPTYLHSIALCELYITLIWRQLPWPPEPSLGAKITSSFYGTCPDPCLPSSWKLQLVTLSLKVYWAGIYPVQAWRGSKAG